MKKVFEHFGGLTPTESIVWMVDHQEVEFDPLGNQFDGLWGRKLHAIDAQGLFCETDKYCRVAVLELRSARSRIKKRFEVDPLRLRLFFTPK